MKKHIKILFELGLVCFVIPASVFITFTLIGSGNNDAGTNYTSQQIANFEMTMSPDTSQGVRLMPDHIIKFVSDSVKNVNDTIKIKSFTNPFTKRFKFSLTTTAAIYLKVLGPGTDSIRIAANGTLAMDYLHPLYDSTIIIVTTGALANYDLEMQGR